MSVLQLISVIYVKQNQILTALLSHVEAITVLERTLKLCLFSDFAVTGIIFHINLLRRIFPSQLEKFYPLEKIDLRLWCVLYCLSVVCPFKPLYQQSS